MSLEYEIGFKEKPSLESLDYFFRSHGFSIDTYGDFTRVYVCEDAPGGIAFFYDEEAGEHKELFEERGDGVVSYGQLVAHPVEPTYIGSEAMLKVIKEKKLVTEIDSMRHLRPERLKFYETALALRDTYKAIVISGQTFEEIDPEKVLWPENRE